MIVPEQVPSFTLPPSMTHYSLASLPSPAAGGAS